MTAIPTMRQQLKQMTTERDRLQSIIDSRPAINVGLPETYIKWSQSIYVLEAAHVLETQQ